MKNCISNDEYYAKLLLNQIRPSLFDQIKAFSYICLLHFSSCFLVLKFYEILATRPVETPCIQDINNTCADHTPLRVSYRLSFPHYQLLQTAMDGAVRKIYHLFYQHHHIPFQKPILSLRKYYNNIVYEMNEQSETLKRFIYVEK